MSGFSVLACVIAVIAAMAAMAVVLCVICYAAYMVRCSDCDLTSVGQRRKELLRKQQKQ